MTKIVAVRERHVERKIGDWRQDALHWTECYWCGETTDMWWGRRQVRADRVCTRHMVHSLGRAFRARPGMTRYLWWRRFVRRYLTMRVERQRAMASAGPYR